MYMRTIGYILLIYIFITIYPVIGRAESASKKEIDISQLAPSLSVPTDNMQPGDEVSNSFILKNDGNKKLMYSLTAKLVSGDALLFTGLEIVVTQGKEELYRGSLRDLQVKRILAVNGEEIISYTVLFPYELGNEYQGLQANVQFLTQATEAPNTPTEEKPPVVILPDVLPNTGLGYTNVLLLGFLCAGTSAYMYRKQKSS
jgi:LPXTG-motif cell wall-anchored protein